MAAEALVELPATRAACPECGEFATLAHCTACTESGDPLLRENRMCLTCFFAHHESGKCQVVPN